MSPINGFQENKWAEEQARLQKRPRAGSTLLSGPTGSHQRDDLCFDAYFAELVNYSFVVRTVQNIAASILLTSC